jgi:glutamate formiminotransferase/formiminotetrahydrofolate cyclodeaminase
MSKQLVECIPNFSEGRRPEVVDAIVEAMMGVDGLILLDRSSDTDHNRSVVTIVGEPKVVEEAAFHGIAKAAALINMDEHEGEHPRMGAADVVPFVPIAGVGIQDCVSMAQRLGQRVGEELSIPVYLYEQAATRLARRNLAAVRRGEYEGIKAEIAKKKKRAPDYGPKKLGPAGAVAIGAREALIAYNVYLTTDDVSIAKEIAKTVRHSSGGLRFVKGAGFLVDGKAQVSMNLTNYHKTPVARVVEMIRREAKVYGVSIEKSELIGLIPQKALEDAATWYLQLNDFDAQQTLETRIKTAQSEGNKQGIGDFLSSMASASPTPGGGSAAAHSGALAAALVAMVARLSVGKKKFKEIEPKMRELSRRADEMREVLSQAVERDAEAFEALMLAFKLPKETNEQKKARSTGIEIATLGAAAVPLEVASLAVDTLKMALQAAQLGNTNAISDAGTAAGLAMASLKGAGLNVRINLKGLSENAESVKMIQSLRKLEKESEEVEAQVTLTVEERGGFSLD